MIHFLMGSDAGKDSLFRSTELVNETFGMEFDLGPQRLLVERAGKDKAKVRVHFPDGAKTIGNTDWAERLGATLFGLPGVSSGDGRAPAFRSLFAYFVRRQSSSAFIAPEKQAAMQQAADYQIALLFLLGLDWRIASDWQKVRDREKNLTELKKAAGAGAFGSFVGKASDLRTQWTVQDARLKELRTRIGEFRVLPQYAELESEADQLTRALGELSNANVIDISTIQDLELALLAEAPPRLSDLQGIYAEAGVALPGLAIRRYDDVLSFHASGSQRPDCGAGTE